MLPGIWVYLADFQRNPLPSRDMTGFLRILAASVASAIIDLTARTGKKSVDFPVDEFANRARAIHIYRWHCDARWLRQPADGCSTNHEWFGSTRWVRRRSRAQSLALRQGTVADCGLAQQELRPPGGERERRK
jgi:hypothetical protein